MCDSLFVAPHMLNSISKTMDMKTNKSTIDHVKVKTIEEALYNVTSNLHCNYYKVYLMNT